MIGAVRNEGDARAIRRQAELAGLSFGVDELSWLGIVFEAGGPDFVLAEEYDAVAFGRDGGIAAFGNFAR